MVSYSYEEDQIDFGDKDPSRLDQWVFTKVENFLNTSNTDPRAKKELESDKIIFFLHLLGLFLYILFYLTIRG